MLWAEWSVQLLPTKPEECAPEHVLNVSFGRIPEPLARLEKFASSFFERKPGVLIVRGFSTIKKIVDVGPGVHDQLCQPTCRMAKVLGMDE